MDSDVLEKVLFNCGFFSVYRNPDVGGVSIDVEELVEMWEELVFIAFFL